MTVHMINRRVVFCSDSGWPFLALTMGGIIAGILIGEGFHSLERAAELTAWFVTIASTYVGVVVCWHSFKSKHMLPVVTILSIMVANYSFTLNFQPEPIVDMFFDFATLMSIIVVFTYSKIYKTVSLAKFGRRKGDCEESRRCSSCNEKLENNAAAKT